jgi:hypothetical protein
MQVWAERQANASNNPLSRFQNLSDRLNTCDHPFYRRMSISELKGIDVDMALGHHRKVSGSVSLSVCH